MGSQMVLAAGIFAQEPGQRLLHILLQFVNRAFLDLYEKCKGNLKSEYYRSSLRRVGAWPEDVIEGDVESIQEECPDASETFETCFVQYVKERFQGKVSYDPPSLQTFVRLFLDAVGKSDTVESAYYFACQDPSIRKVTCMDACRQALYSCVTTSRVHVELASEVGGGGGGPASEAPSRRSEASDPRRTRQERARSEEPPSPPGRGSRGAGGSAEEEEVPSERVREEEGERDSEEVEAEQESRQRDEERGRRGNGGRRPLAEREEEDTIRPSDSISNVGAQPHAPPRSSASAVSAVSAVSAAAARPRARVSPPVSESGISRHALPSSSSPSFSSARVPHRPTTTGSVVSATTSLRDGTTSIGMKTLRSPTK